MESASYRVAIIDMYNGFPNQGMRCILDILQRYSLKNNLVFTTDVFDLRGKNELPDLSYDLYISTGGPGSPWDGEGTDWENRYFTLLGDLHRHNLSDTLSKKPVFFICHSFQMACRYFEVGQVTKRRSTSFGVFPVHPTDEAKKEPYLSGLPDPFFVVDSRDWQVIQADHQRLTELGGAVICYEKIRPHVPYERCMMVIRFTPYFFGTQFHPEADAIGMSVYMMQEEKKNQIIEAHGAEKYYDMLDHLEDPDKIMLTQNMILPTFLDHCLQRAEKVNV